MGSQSNCRPFLIGDVVWKGTSPYAIGIGVAIGFSIVWDSRFPISTATQIPNDVLAHPGPFTPRFCCFTGETFSA